MPPRLPSRKQLAPLFNQAIGDLQQIRPGSKLTTPWYSDVGKAVFATAYKALEGYCRASDQTTPYVVPVFSGPVGSGKTSFAMAFITAVTRFAETHSNAPQGCLLVVDQITKADALWNDLSTLIPGQVAVWTTDHDPACKEWPTLGRPPKQAYGREELQRFPVAIVTHNWFRHEKVPTRMHSSFLLGSGRAVRRALTVVDERLEEVKVFDIGLGDAQRLLEAVQKSQGPSFMLVQKLRELVQFMEERQGTSPFLNPIERPKDELEKWERAAESLQWFATEDASTRVMQSQGLPEAEKVFGFAKALTAGCAFILRDQGGLKGTHFAGYVAGGRPTPGVALLDATANLDGVTDLCPWQMQMKCPPVDYRNLQIVHVQAPRSERRLDRYLAKEASCRDYQRWAMDTITKHMQPGQRGLAVCKKELVDREFLPAWPKDDPRHAQVHARAKEWVWDIEGRKLCVVHWGVGVGANAWKEADVVFLFDRHYRPHVVDIAIAQGVQGYSASDGPLAQMTTMSTHHEDVERIKQGHLLRWSKQMGLRGKARDFDQHGVCGAQKIVFCDLDLRDLTANAHTLFPGSLPIITDNAGSDESGKQPIADKVLGCLGRADRPTDVIATDWVMQQLHGVGVKAKSWRAVSKNINWQNYEQDLLNVGLEYVPVLGKRAKGSLGSHFKVLRQHQTVTVDGLKNLAA
jgi:hypothetical protein